MFRLSSEISISTFRFNQVVGVEVESSWDELTDVCRLTIPRKLNWRGKPLAWTNQALMRRGDQVQVQLGYDDNNQVVFEGYLHKITADTPVLLECQDAAWRLKQSTITKAWRSVELTELLRAILPGELPFQAPTVELGPFRISSASPAQVLAELRKTYFLKSFFRNGTLYCGLAYVPELQSTHIIRMERNVVSHSLEYMRKEDVAIKLKMVSMFPDGSRQEYETGDQDGEQRTMYYHSMSQAKMKALADQEIERLKYEGYRGEITIFGQPFVQHGDVVDLRDASYPERDGRYFVKTVVTAFGADGYRQTLTLDAKL
jgi:hypothetical protein